MWVIPSYFQISFNEEGEVRKISEDLVHGVTDKGGIFVNRFQQTIEKKRSIIFITLLCPILSSGARSLKEC